MLYTAVLGADKTTTSVGTGNQEFHPVYITAGNLTNEMRRAYGEGVVPLTFLPIPSSKHYRFNTTPCADSRCLGTTAADREHADTEEFRIFKKQLYHAALTQILRPLQPWMTTPRVIRCPDGHYRRAVCSISTRSIHC